jgi:hypothetical protein
MNSIAPSSHNQEPQVTPHRNPSTVKVALQHVPSTVHSNSERFARVISLLDRLMLTFNGSYYDECWDTEAQVLCLHLFHDDFVYELPSQEGGLDNHLSLNRDEWINILKQFKQMGGMTEIQWMMEAPTSCDSPYGQLTGTSLVMNARTPMGLKQNHSSTMTLAEDGRIINVSPKKTQITNVLTLQADFLRLLESKD